ncbi:hypothetical protein [Belnapia moabensis]|uniref:hypothetical protein n=1 Tax=Belnapia moabensis TaxID=365533 RepID=UPI0005BE3848|nr:hypothetical protein [Belnapia moabensis]
MEAPDEPSAWLWATTGPQKDFASAYAEFRHALTLAFPDPEAARAVGEAYNAYAGALQEPWKSGDLARRVGELADAYATSVHEALSGAEARTRIEEAFGRYVAATRAAWAATDPAEVKPEHLTMIAQSMAWIAAIAAEIRRRPPAGT